MWNRRKALEKVFLTAVDLLDRPREPTNSFLICFSFIFKCASIYLKLAPATQGVSSHQTIYKWEKNVNKSVDDPKFPFLILPLSKNSNLDRVKFGKFWVFHFRSENSQEMSALNRVSWKTWSMLWTLQKNVR